MYQISFPLSVTTLALTEAATPWSVVSAVTNQWSLAALALVVVYLLVMKFNQKPIPKMAWAMIALLVALPIGVTLYQELAKAKHANDGIYRIRVTVTDHEQTPVEDARVWSSFGGEAKKVAGGWQFDIPAATKPQDGKLTIFAKRENSKAGQQPLQLADDYNLALTIPLPLDDSAQVRGQVLDARGKALAGARVWVVGYGNEAVTTPANGEFVLAAHQAAHRQVELHAEKTGYKADNRFYPAGGAAITINLEK